MHQLVAFVFLGPRPEGQEVNHKDGNRSFSHAWNLEYVTRQGNILHSLHVLGNIEHAREVSRSNLKKAHAMNQQNGFSAQRKKSPEQRERLRLTRVGQIPWWIKKGFNSLKEASRSER